MSFNPINHSRLFKLGKTYDSPNTILHNVKDAISLGVCAIGALHALSVLRFCIAQRAYFRESESLEVVAF
eukprot:scaffold249342_cov62-Cyclotella_meneghiniana.AAC.4